MAREVLGEMSGPNLGNGGKGMADQLFVGHFQAVTGSAVRFVQVPLRPIANDDM